MGSGPRSTPREAVKYEIGFRPEVVDDLANGSKWYENRTVGLGAKFLDECRVAIDRITESPECATAGRRGVRSARLRRFPYVVHYRIEKSTIVIVAVLFGGRDPSVWEDRV